MFIAIMCKVPGIVLPTALFEMQYPTTLFFGTGYTTKGNTLEYCSGYTFCENVCIPPIDYCSTFQQP